MIGSIRLFGESVDMVFNLSRCLYDLSVEMLDHNEAYSSDLETLAKEGFERSLELEPNLSKSYYYLGYIYSNLGNIDHADECFERFLALTDDKSEKAEILEELSNNRARKSFSRAKHLYDAGFYEEVIALLLPIYDVHSDWWQLSHLIGKSYRMMDRYDSAIEYFTKTLEFNTGNVEAMNELTLCYSAISRLDMAIRYATEAFNHDPSSIEIVINMCAVYYYSGDLEVALATIEKALSLDNDDEVALKWRNIIQADIERLKMNVGSEAGKLN
jgi:tetratricopeptide (TPR) repeat protein